MDSTTKTANDKQCQDIKVSDAVNISNASNSSAMTSDSINISQSLNQDDYKGGNSSLPNSYSSSEMSTFSSSLPTDYDPPSLNPRATFQRALSSLYGRWMKVMISLLQHLGCGLIYIYI